MFSKTNATDPVRPLSRPAPPRWGCIDIPELLFQWVLQQHPDWRSCPVAIVQEEKPQSPLLSLNAQARQLGLRVGMRYLDALTGNPQLRARAIPPTLRGQIQQEIVEILREFSPQIAPCPERTGVFYAALDGLIGLYPSWEAWIESLRQRLQQRGYHPNIVLGYQPLTLLAVARLGGSSPQILASPDEEKHWALKADLACLELPLQLFQGLQALGLQTLGDFLKLSSESLLDRFGSQAYRIHRQARGGLEHPLAFQAEPELWQAHLSLDYGEIQSQALLFLCKRLLDPLLVQLYRKGRAIRRLHLELQLQNQVQLKESLGLSEPGLEPKRILELLRLRLDSLQLEAGVSDLWITLEDVECPQEQLELFEEHSRSELSAANRVLDQIRAELGSQAVVRARLQEGHLPVAGFTWETLERLGKPPSPPSRQGPQALIRRFFARPIPIARPRPRDLLAGPYRLSGGWWNRLIERDYYYFFNASGQCLWGYFDARRQRWFVEGRLDG